MPADKLILICSPNHPWAGRQRIDLKKLNGQNFVAFERDIPSRRAIDQILRAHQVQVRVVMELDNIETIKRSVEIGAGVSIVPLLSVQREVQSGALVQLHFTRKTFWRPLGVIVKRNRALKPAAQKLIELLQRPQAARPENRLIVSPRIEADVSRSTVHPGHAEAMLGFGLTCAASLCNKRRGAGYRCCSGCALLLLFVLPIQCRHLSFSSMAASPCKRHRGWGTNTHSLAVGFLMLSKRNRPRNFASV